MLKIKAATQKSKLFVFLLGVLVLLLSGCGLGGKKEVEKQVVESGLGKIDKTAPEAKEIKMPEVSLTARADGNAANLKIFGLEDFAGFEFTLSYTTANGASQGSFSEVDLKPEQKTYSKEILFGSCSAGKCKYDEGVNKADLEIIFRTVDGRIKNFAESFKL